MADHHSAVGRCEHPPGPLDAGPNAPVLGNAGIEDFSPVSIECVCAEGVGDAYVKPELTQRGGYVEGLPTSSPWLASGKNGGRQKPRNIRRDARVAISIADHENSFRYLLARGKVIEITTEGAWDHIRKLNLKYTGSSDYPKHDGQVRLLIKILPEHVFFGLTG